MKKILLLLALGVSAGASLVSADDLRDNRLQIDNSRLEREEELHFGAQSERVKDLFDAADEATLQEKQLQEEKQLTTEGGQLFSAIVGQVENPRESQLFQDDDLASLKPQQELSDEGQTVWADLLPGTLYASLVFVLLGVTGLVSYQIATRDRLE